METDETWCSTNEQVATAWTMGSGRITTLGSEVQPRRFLYVDARYAVGRGTTCLWNSLADLYVCMAMIETARTFSWQFAMKRHVKER